MSPDNSLYQALKTYASGDFYPCHMPGHKRNPASGEMAAYYGIDLTEIEGFDNLHHAEGILKEAQLRANRLYGAEETFFLVNGSTAGILAAVMTAAMPGDELLIARNCHKSVYHAAILQGLSVRYYYPDTIREYGICDGASAEKIGALLDACPGVKAVVVTSPTYEGIVSDISAIAEAVHRRDRVLIVDEAHGAHFGLSKLMPQDAVAGGADLVIHSLHKTLPAMTQTALLHVNGGRVDRERLRAYLSMLQTSSPSYVLMASMDACVRFIEERGRERFAAFRMRYEGFLEQTKDLKKIRIGKMTEVSQKSYALTDWDFGKILISVGRAALTGKELAVMMRETYHLEPEMAAGSYALAIMTLMDEAAGWQRLADALVEIDDRIEESEGSGQTARLADRKPLAAAMTLSQAFHSGRRAVLLHEAAGQIAADFICLYPPGIPLAAPGEILNETVIGQIGEGLNMGLTVQGVTKDGRIFTVL